MRRGTSASFVVSGLMFAASGALAALANDFQWEHLASNRRWEACSNWVVSANPPPAACYPSVTGDNAYFPAASQSWGDVHLVNNQTIGNLYVNESVIFVPQTSSRTLTAAIVVVDASDGDVELQVIDIALMTN